MISGETVIVRTFEEGEADPFGSPALSEKETVVDNVLVQVGMTADLTGSTRPDGVTVRYTLHFPKTYNVPLRGAEIFVRKEWHKVVGDPAWFTVENCPTAWNYPVEVTRTDG